MKLAAIDIGSNAVRLLFMNVYETEKGPKFIKDSIYRVPLRLGEDAFLYKKISDEKLEQFIKTMKAFKHLIDIHEAPYHLALATSAMREAKNNTKVVQKIKEKTGIELNIISGDEEADIIFSNHIEDMLEPKKNYLYIDVGGGSTEFIIINNGKMIDKASFNIGTLRLKNKMIHENHWQELKNWLVGHEEINQGIEGIGSGGNINFVLKTFTKSKRTNLSRDIIETCYRMLKVVDREEMEIKLEIRPDRADVIVHALEIFRKIMTWTDMNIIHVPKSGLPEGIIKKLYYQLKKNKTKNK